jgi:protein involved in ribonucleotide reduction
MQEDFFNKRFIATGIGSVPIDDPTEACEFVKDIFKDDIIFWPQLVRSSFLENMYVQFSEGLPAVKIDEADKKIYIATRAQNYFQQQLELTLGHYLNDNIDYFAISKSYAQGLHFMLEDEIVSNVEYFKGQITGPISFGLTVKEESGHSIIYNPELYQVLIKVLGMKAKWQIKKLKSRNPKLKIIIFIDEPYLVSLGTSYVSLKIEDVISSLDEIIDSIHKEGALAGIHCCGNTDWSVILKTKIDILNFDAFGYLDNLLLYQEELDSYLHRGSILAWGIVPTSDEVHREAIEDRLLEIMDKAKEKNTHLFDRQVLITPSCGTGTLPVELSKKIYNLTATLTELLNKDKI